ncbi:MAG: phospho-sugar mutase [Clostridiales bacterium]|nr:phospho-sugar mutase [Clostridiales bacterium]
MNDIHALYELWKEKAVLDPDLKTELDAMEGNEDAILDSFYCNLQFGTGGLRGVIGAGTNRMNVYTVGQTTQGLADYLNANFENPSVAIAFDSRIKSEVFAHQAAGVLAANGIKVYIYPELMPTPMLSFAVKRLGCSSGIVITASHNPSKYNGYKCYDPHGYQMTDEAAAATYEYIGKVDIFTGVKRMDFDDALAEDMVDFIEDWVKEEFFAEVLKTQINPGICKKAGLKIIYTPLNGTGNKPVRRMLRVVGVKDVSVVPEQEKPDGHFPTCSYPNPEFREAFESALAMAETSDADLLIATDPDCDRIGIAVHHDGDYRLMTGNEVGAMLSEYILEQRTAKGNLPEHPYILKSIVTSPLISKIAEAYGCEMVDLLTGFKYTGEFITKLAEKGEFDRFLLGMEESYGYLSGAQARDKDAVGASVLVAEMASYYKTLGMDLVDFMDSIYKKYGYYLNVVNNFGFEGAQGMQQMQDIMSAMRKAAPAQLGGKKVEKTSDYKLGEIVCVASGEKCDTGLPRSNVLSYDLEDGNRVMVRPSGTEPKIKVYITSRAADRAAAEKQAEAFSADMKSHMGIK